MTDFRKDERVEFRILGPVELWADGKRHDLGSRKERCVLAVLLWELGRPIAASTLIDQVWGDDPPAKPLDSLYSNVSRLRSRLRHACGNGRDWELRRSGSYALDVSQSEVDFRRFRELRDNARAAAASGDDERVSALLHEAEQLWRGAPLADIGGMWADRVRLNLNEEHYAASLMRFDAELRLGRHTSLVGELFDLAAQHPLKEAPTKCLMLALYRSGRTPDALSAYLTFWRRLRDEVGSEPSTDLRSLHQRILNDDPELAVKSPARPLQPGTPTTGMPSGTPASTLPRDNPDFTGRAAELDTLSAWMSSGQAQSAVPVVAISGMPGVGKTALAVHAAHMHADRYADQLYVSLRGHAPDGDPMDPASVLRALLRALGVMDDVIPASIEDRAALWRSRLAGRRALILLDDALDSAQVRPLLPGTSGCLVLITARRRAIDLPGVLWLPLDPMPPTEAASLFTRIAGKDRIRDHAGVASVLRLCGYLPMEIQIAGSELRRHPAWDTRDLASRLQENRAEDRQVGAALALSYRHLTTAQQRLLRRLALHPGPGFSRYAAAAAAGDQSAGETERGLDALLDHYLIEEPAPGRFAFHDLIRVYARHLAEICDRDADREATVRRMLDYYLCLADQADRLVYPFHRRLPAWHGRVPVNLPSPRTRRDCRKWMEAERPGLLAAARYATEHCWAEHASLLPHMLARFLDTWGYWTDAVNLHRRAVEAWRTAGNSRGEAKALTELCFILGRMGRYGEASECARQALAIAQDTFDRAEEAESLDNLGLILWQTSQYAEALSHFHQAVTIWRALGDRHGEADALGHSAAVLWHVNRYAEALQLAEKALAIYRELSDIQGEANSLNNLGDLQQSVDCHDLAIKSYRQALDMFQDIGDRQGEAIASNNIGDICRKTGRTGDALAHYRTALDIYRDIGDRRCEADALNNMGAAYRQMGHYGDALDQHQKALVLAHEITERFLEARSYHGSGDAHLAVRNYGAAAEDYRTAIELSRQIRDRFQEAEALRGLGHVLLHTAGESAARTHWHRALGILDEIQKQPEADEVRALLRSPNRSAL
jgi:tetratricopeptide (TPR) repeat protein/DNA-binding SARP family transcriptional activator